MKGLVTRKTPVQYESRITSGKKVMAKIKFFKSRSNFKVKVTRSTRHVFVKHGCPRRQQSLNMAKISKSYILTPPHPRGMGCHRSVRNPLMNLQSKFGYCIITQTLNFALCLKRDYRQTDRQTNKQTDGQTIQTLDAPGGPFRPGA